MHDLRAANAEQDPQRLGMGDPLGERGVEARTALLDEGEVEAGRVGDRLEVVGRAEVVVAAWDCRELPCAEARDCLRERVAEVGVLRVAAVAGPEAGVDGQLRQVGETSDLLGAGRLAARQGAELVQVDRLCAVGLQVGVDEADVAHLVVGVVVDVLVHVPVQHLDRVRVVRIAASAGHFAVLDAGELVVLLPEIGLDDLGRSEEPENRRVAVGQATACERFRRLEQQASRAEAGRSNRGALEQEGPSAGQVPRLFACFHELLLSEFGSVSGVPPEGLVSFHDREGRRVFHPREPLTSIAACGKLAVTASANLRRPRIGAAARGTGARR